MKYLVLGSRGQIGLSLCQHLRSQNHEVREFDHADGALFDLRRYNNNELRKAVLWADLVYFLAWDVGGSAYLARYQDTYDFVMNNVAITHTVFTCLAETKRPFIFASSQMASMSYSSYGLTKSLAERITATLGGITVKFWNVYGIELDPAKTHVVTDFIQKARDTSVIDMRTDGTESRQMLHADDCSRALDILAQCYRELPRDQPYHVTSFEWHTMLEVAHLVADLFPGCQVRPAAAKDLVQRDARNEPDRYILQYWQPQITLSQGIADIVTRCRMTEPADLTEFWNQEHRLDSGWLTGTDWHAMQRYYGISDQDIQHKSCLEIGVGKATVTRVLATLARPLYCCDISSTALAKTKYLAAQSWLTADLDQVPAVDVVLCHLVLVHCDDEECVRILRSIRLNSEGRILCQFSSFRDQTVGISEASGHVQHMLDLGHKHWFRTTEQIRDIVHSAGLQIHSITQHDPGSYHGWQGQYWQFLELRKKNEKGL